MSKSLFYCSTLPPSTQVALKCAGYETVDDLTGLSAETLSKELGINIADSQALITATQAPNGMPLSQSVASLSRRNIMKCNYPAVNKILGGGLPRGHILEISGPPGSFKESLVSDFVRIFVEADEQVIFVDMQNMTSPEAIHGSLQRLASHYNRDLIYYARLHTLPDLLIFMHNLLSELRPTDVDGTPYSEFDLFPLLISPRSSTIKANGVAGEYPANPSSSLCIQEFDNRHDVPNGNQNAQS